MLPLLALPLLMSATGTGLTVATDVAFGVYHATQGRWGDASNAAAGFIGSKNNNAVACFSEALVHGFMSNGVCKGLRCLYNGVRGTGEFAHGDYLDGFIHTTAALTGFDCVSNLVKKVSQAKTAAEASTVAKQGLREIARETGTASGGFFKHFVDPFAQYFKKARHAADPVKQAFKPAGYITAKPLLGLPAPKGVAGYITGPTTQAATTAAKKGVFRRVLDFFLKPFKRSGTKAATSAASAPTTVPVATSTNPIAGFIEYKPSLSLA